MEVRAPGYCHESRRDVVGLSRPFSWPGVKLVVREQFEAVHRQAQVRERVPGRFVRLGRFHATLRAVEALAQRTIILGITEFAQEPTNAVRPLPGLFDQPQRNGKFDPAGLCVLEDTAFENAALRRPVGVEPAGSIRAQGRARLAKASNRCPGARDRNLQSECPQFLWIVALLELNAIEERAVAAQSAAEAELFA